MKKYYTKEKMFKIILIAFFGIAAGAFPTIMQAVLIWDARNTDGYTLIYYNTYQEMNFEIILFTIQAIIIFVAFLVVAIYLMKIRRELAK